MHHKKIRDPDWRQRCNQNQLVQEAGADWLAGKSSGLGFTVEPTAIRADGYRTHCFTKPKGAVNRGGKPVRFTSLEFNGLLTVTDVALFRQALFQGIGPCKAYGCGLLLVRRP